MRFIIAQDHIPLNIAAFMEKIKHSFLLPETELKANGICRLQRHTHSCNAQFHAEVVC